MKDYRSVKRAHFPPRTGGEVIQILVRNKIDKAVYRSGGTCVAFDNETWFRRPSFLRYPFLRPSIAGAEAGCGRPGALVKPTRTLRYLCCSRRPVRRGA